MVFVFPRSKKIRTVVAMTKKVYNPRRVSAAMLALIDKWLGKSSYHSLFFWRIFPAAKTKMLFLEMLEEEPFRVLAQCFFKHFHHYSDICLNLKAGAV